MLILVQDNLVCPDCSGFCQSWRAGPGVDAEREALLALREEEGDAAHGGGESPATDAACASQNHQGREAAVRVREGEADAEHRNHRDERVHRVVHTRATEGHQERVHDTQRRAGQARHRRQRRHQNLPGYSLQSLCLRYAWLRVQKTVLKTRDLVRLHFILGRVQIIHVVDVVREGIDAGVLIVRRLDIRRQDRPHQPEPLLRPLR